MYSNLDNCASICKNCSLIKPVIYHHDVFHTVQVCELFKLYKYVPL